MICFNLITIIFISMMLLLVIIANICSGNTVINNGLRKSKANILKLNNLLKPYNKSLFLFLRKIRTKLKILKS